MSAPLEIRLRGDRKSLSIAFNAMDIYQISAQSLRVESPSAEVQGHHPSEKKIVTGKENVKIDSVEPVGNYAVRLVFDDGHKTGIYTWEYLKELGEMQ